VGARAHLRFATTAIKSGYHQPSSLSTEQRTPIGHIIKHCWIYEPDERPSMSDISLSLHRNNASLLHNPRCMKCILDRIFEPLPLTYEHSSSLLGSAPPPPLLSALLCPESPPCIAPEDSSGKENRQIVDLSTHYAECRTQTNNRYYLQQYGACN
jgi:hypothetical protein